MTRNAVQWMDSLKQTPILSLDLLIAVSLFHVSQIDKKFLVYF